MGDKRALSARISLAFVFIPGTHLTLGEPRMVIGSWNQPSGVSSVTLLNTLEVFLESQGRTQCLEKDKDTCHSWPLMLTGSQVRG